MKFLALLTLLVLPAAAAPVDRAWAVIDKSLQSGDSDHRQEALAALATAGTNNPEVVRRAAAALQDKHTFVRRAAALALGELKANSAIPELTKALEDDSPEVSFAAAEALTQLGDANGRNLLMAVLAGERKDTPGMFTNAMRKAKDKIHHPEGLILMGTQDAAGAMFGPAAMVIPAVKNAADMKSKGAPGRVAAVAYLGKYPDAYAIQLLEWALSDDSHFVRIEAAKQLGERGNAASIDKLMSRLEDDHNLVRDMAAAAIIRITRRDGAAGEVSAGPVVPTSTASKK